MEWYNRKWPPSEVCLEFIPSSQNILFYFQTCEFAVASLSLKVHFDRVRNPKPEQSKQLTSNTAYPKVNTSKQPEVRENASGFDFTSEWLRKWRKKLFTQSQKRLAHLKRGKTRVTKLRFFLSQSKYKQPAWSAGKREWFWFYIWLI